MLDDNKKVAVESIGRGAVGFQPISNPLIRRIWHKPGIVKMIPLEEIREVFTSPGGEILFTRHLLIKDPEVRKELDLPMDEEKTLTDKDLSDLLKGNPAKLKEAMPKLYKVTQERIAEKAIEMEIDNVTKLETIKEHTGIDVYKLIQEKKSEKKK
jgi:hypothetical protein